MYKTLSTGLQSSIVRWLFSGLFIIALSVMTYRNWGDISILNAETVFRATLALVAVLSLTFVNLYCEAKKWQHLLDSKVVTWKSALRQIVAGMCSGFLTPNRVGEFAGRRYLLPKDEKYKALTLTAIGGSIQGAATLIFGLFGLWYFPVEGLVPAWIAVPWPLLLLAVVALALLFMGYRKRWKFLTDIAETLTHIRKFSWSKIRSVFGWALLRYLVFCMQFVVALFILGYEGDMITCFAGVFLLYFIQSYIPGAGFGELGVREVLAVVIFGTQMPYPLLAALAGFSLWLANIAVPVAIGAFAFGMAPSTTL